MSDELMNDRNTPPNTEPARIMSLRDARKCVVEVSFSRADNRPVPPSWRQEFPSRPAAEEFARSVQPDPRQLGSAKQARLKRATLLRCTPSELDNLQVHTTITESKPNDNPRLTASRRGMERVRPLNQQRAISDTLPNPDDDGTDDLLAAGEPSPATGGDGAPGADGPVAPDRDPVSDRPERSNPGADSWLDSLLSSAEAELRGAGTTPEATPAGPGTDDDA